jgi:hypothetical protein
MQVVELSDHPGDLLAQPRPRRAAGGRAPRRAAADPLAPYQAEVARTSAERDQARAARRWLAWLRGAVTARRAQRRLRAAQAAPAGPGRAAGRRDRDGRDLDGRDRDGGDRVEALAAGARGEQLAAGWLGQALGDDWTLLRGYRNRRGEIDHLLLGPRGLVAIESKHWNATVYCSGDRWVFVKHDNYGNAVDQGEMTDAGGRSPSEQLNQPADELERFLRSRGHGVAIGRVVLLTHPRGRVGACQHPTVRVMTIADEAAGLLRRSGAGLAAAELAELRALIIRDHRYHAARRPGRPARAGRPRPAADNGRYQGDSRFE